MIRYEIQAHKDNLKRLTGHWNHLLIVYLKESIPLAHIVLHSPGPWVRGQFPQKTKKFFMSQ